MVIKANISKNYKPGSESGFTLLEVIFSICIISVGLLGVASMQAGAMRGNSYADGLSMGSTWASDKIEKLISLAETNYNHADLTDTDNDGDSGLDHAAAGTADHQETQDKYTIFWNVSDNSLLNNTKTIAVIVVWSNQGKQKSVSIRHIMPKMS